MSSVIERRRVVEMWSRGHAAALATLVRVEGSSYRATGARLLIGADGEYEGAISAGCLESQIVRRAPWLVRSGALVQRYSTAFDDTAEIPYGLGCGGTVEVLLEPAGTPEFDALFVAMEASLSDEARIVRSYLPNGDGGLRREVLDGAGKTLFRSAGLNRESEADFVEELRPPLRLFLFGAGDDAQPVARIATLLGWNVVILDSRTQWAKVERFAEVEAVLAGPHVGRLRPGPADAVVLMTHSYEQDRSWLEQILPCRPRYLGLLGSRHRSALLVAEAAQSLGWPLERACERLFSPVGLDLGGDGAESIALGIIAEIHGFMEGKVVHARCMTPSRIEEQIALGGASRYLQSQCAS